MSEQEKGFNIEIDESVSEGVFSNLAIINHSSTEFVVDFVSIMPGIPKPRVKSRIIMTPQHAKRLLVALQDNIDNFEQDNGKILDQNKAPNLASLNFGNKGEA
ncbi:DUF3467 domain-containing protein [Myroides sp. LJL116]